MNRTEFLFTLLISTSFKPDKIRRRNAAVAGSKPGKMQRTANKKAAWRKWKIVNQNQAAPIKKKGSYIIAKVKRNEKNRNIKNSREKMFQKSYGNTYHTVTVIVNDEEMKSEITYGYGNHYLQTAADMLRNAGYDIPEDNGKAYAMMTKYDHDAEDVKRKKDL